MLRTFEKMRATALIPEMSLTLRTTKTKKNMIVTAMAPATILITRLCIVCKEREKDSYLGCMLNPIPNLEVATLPILSEELLEY